jgi:hypothetical protein
MCVEVVAGSFNTVMERTAAYIVVIAWRLDIPLDDLRTCLSGVTHRNTCQAQENYGSDQAN